MLYQEYFNDYIRGFRKILYNRIFKDLNKMFIYLNNKICEFIFVYDFIGCKNL